MRFIIIVKATKDTEMGVMPEEGEIEVRQLFELEDFGPSKSIDRFRDLGVGGKK